MMLVHAELYRIQQARKATCTLDHFPSCDLPRSEVVPSNWNLLLNFIPRNRDKVAGRHVLPLSSGVNSISNLCRFIPPILSGARYFLGIMQASAHLGLAQHSTSFLGVRAIVVLEGAPWMVGEVQPVILGYHLASYSGMEE